ncbi:MAG: hypothetical protein R3338_14365, partial [Thermoanaerobaculia bacterium]|nr:hypothetical protein [Thermoanaerobaculia bacterium]
MPLEEIYQELESDLSFLESTTRNPKGSHASLRTVFERSWSLLGDRERTALARLAFFRGGFRREAAGDVADATLPMLMRLVDASLITPSGDGRFHVHAVIQQFCLEKLEHDVGSLRSTADRYREHFRTYTAACLKNMYTSSEPEALAALSADLPNIVSAWEQIFDADEDLDRDFPSQLVVFFDRLGFFREGVRLFERARLSVERGGRDRPTLLREIHANLAWLHYRQGRHQNAERSALAA